MSDQTTRRRRPRLFTLLAIFAALTVVMALLIYQRDIMPVVHIPVVVAPKPNGYDDYTAAMATYDKHTLADYWAPIDRDPVKARTTKVPGAYIYYPFAQQADFVDANRVLLAKLHESFHYAFLNTTHSNTPEHRHGILEMSMFLPCVENVRAARGDWPGAVNAYLDLVQLAMLYPRGGDVKDHSVAFVLQLNDRMAKSPVIWEAVDHLNAKDARLAALRMQAILSKRVPYADNLMEEKWERQRSLLELFRKPHWRWTWAGVREASGAHDIAAALWQWGKASFVSNRTIMSKYTTFMNGRIANARMPYAARMPLPPIPSDPINADDLDDLAANYKLGNESPLYYSTEQFTANVLAMTMLALRAYHLEHGSYPDTLSALVPGYLPTLPDDPFALSGPLQYRRTGNTFLLYSIGPDGKDDGGKPVSDPKKAGGWRKYTIDQDSLGDIVAGVNKW